MARVPSCNDILLSSFHVLCLLQEVIKPGISQSVKQASFGVSDLNFLNFIFFSAPSPVTIEWHLPRCNHSAPSHPCPQKKLIIHPLLLNCKHFSSKSWIIWNQYWPALIWKTRSCMMSQLSIDGILCFISNCEMKRRACVYRWFWLQSSPTCSGPKELGKLTVPVGNSMIRFGISWFLS